VHHDINFEAIANLMHKYLYSYNITILYKFRALLCLSSGGLIVYVQHLVLSLSVSGHTLHWLREKIRMQTHSPNTTYIGCPRRNVKYFRRVFLMLNYTNITQNTYIQSWTVTELMAIEKCGLLWCPRTVRRPWRHIHPLRKPGKEIS